VTRSGEDQIVSGAPGEPVGDARPRASRGHARDDGPLIEQFDRVVERQPDAPALVADGTHLSYRQLQSWSYEIAGALTRQLGTGRQPVATLIGHSPAVIAAMLGIARTGRPFMNLDPTLPELRLGQMLDLAHASAVVVADAASPEGARVPGGVRSIAVGTPPETAVSADADVVWSAADDVACLLFTSGSTGSPKGIIWPHATLVKDARAGRQAMRFSDSDRIGLVMPIEFVAGLIVAVWGLTSGATLCMFDPRRHPAAELTQWIARERLTTLHTTPTLLRAIVRAVSPEQRFPELRLVSTCGEPVTGADVRSVREHLSATCVFVNWTGSSEVGVLALRRIDAGERLDDGPIAAGLAVEGIVVEIAPLEGDPEQGAPEATQVHGGVLGELVVESEHIALGYCGDGRDLSDRFTSADGIRRYRTGDLATLGSSGELRLHGRRDVAVKISGYLVEPSEVEAALLAADEVADAHVAADRGDGPPRLIAYVVPAPGYVLSVSHLRTGLRERLPMYMVPPTIVQVPELPRTERGKIDQAALRAAHTQVLRPEVRAPSTDLEIYIVEIWRNVLGIRDIGADDDFFELGGDSLAVEEVLAELQKLGPDLPTATFISSPTVAGLAAAAESGPAAHLGGGVVQMRHVDNREPTVVCFAGAGGIVLAFERLVRDLDLEVPVYGVQMHALEYRGIPDFTVSRAAARFLNTFPTLRTRGPYVLVGHSYGGVVAFEVARRLRLAGHDVALLALVDAFPPEVPVAADAVGSGRPAGRLAAQAARVWKALPEDDAMGKLISIPRMLTAGPVRYRGIKHYGGFYNRGWVMQQLHRPKPYSGDAVVYVGERNLTETDHHRWQRVLSGSWELTSVPGDHHTVLREPFVQALAEDLRARILRARAGEPE
jgi:acyl-coenzyme A synthetase/AMP-(fatty) acid ligase/thioesterase domain-containing protein